MRTRFASWVVVGVLASAGLSAQTKISGTLSCAKADPVYTIPAEDADGTVMGVAKVACTWSKAIEMAGSTGKDGSGVAAFEMHGGKTKDHGIHVGTMSNGDKYYVHFQGTGTVNADHSGAASGTWTFEGGTGKLKGLTGKGTYKVTARADGTATEEIEGEYKTP